MKIRNRFIVTSLLVLTFLTACAKQYKKPQELVPDRLAGRDILFEGLITEGSVEEFHYLQPGVFLDIVDFPIVPERGRPFNPIGLPGDVLDILRHIRPEIRLWGTDLGVAVERRGWQQSVVVRSPSCLILYDFRVDVRDVSLGRNGPFGRVPGTRWWVVVLERRRHNTDGLYILVVTQVQINLDRVGQPFTENHNGVRKARENAGKPVTIPAMPRWFIVEHELGHVDQIRTAFREVVDRIVRQFQLCNPTKPVVRHKALIEQGFAQAWQTLTANGAGGQHEMGSGYPNNEIEREVREKAWALYDARSGG